MVEKFEPNKADRTSEKEQSSFIWIKEALALGVPQSWAKELQAIVSRKDATNLAASCGTSVLARDYIAAYDTYC